MGFINFFKYVYLNIYMCIYVYKAYLKLKLEFFVNKKKENEKKNENVIYIF